MPGKRAVAVAVKRQRLQCGLTMAVRDTARHRHELLYFSDCPNQPLAIVASGGQRAKLTCTRRTRSDTTVLTARRDVVELSLDLVAHEATRIPASRCYSLMTVCCRPLRNDVGEPMF